MLRSKSLGGRLNRLLRAAHPVFARPDDAWARGRLTDEEFVVYSSMDPRDREHAVRVAGRLIALHPASSPELIAAALLHDCGKQLRPYVWLERIMAGLVERPASPALEPLPENWRTRRYTPLEIRLLHPQLGAALIRAANGRECVARIVELHHAPNLDDEARIIHDVDELE